MGRTHVDEVEVETVNLRHELRQRVQSFLTLSPVVFSCPIRRELPDRLKLHALGLVFDRLVLGRPPRRGPPSKIEDCFFGDLRTKWANPHVQACAFSSDTHNGCSFLRV